MPHHLLPSLREALAQDRPHRLLTLALAAWLRYLRGTDDAGRPIAVEDPHAATLTALARAGGTDPRPLLAVEHVFGCLGRCPEFVAELETALRRLDDDGVEATIRLALTGSDPLHP
jgi:fructuronate reductase/mannitol 2-dehydrogenase